MPKVAKKHRKSERFAVAYCRVSKDNDSQTLSIETQVAAAKDWAKRHRVTLIRIFVDKCPGATDPVKREDMNKLLKLLPSRQIDYVLIQRSDRISRDTAITGFLEYYITKYGARILTTEEGPDDVMTPQQQLLRGMLASVAQYERALISQRTMENIATLRKKGRDIGRPAATSRPHRAMLFYITLFLKKYGASPETIFAYLQKQRLPELRLEHVEATYYMRSPLRRRKPKAKISFRQLRQYLRPYFREFIWTPTASPKPLESSSPATLEATTALTGSP